MAALTEAAAIKEFNICVLGGENVGKTSLCKRLEGTPFSRKNSSKPSMEETATRYSIECATSSGLLLFHLYDWAWQQKLREGSINQQLMRGNDGQIFMYDVTDRRSRTDFVDYNDWYGRAAGFDKPCLVVSSKNDQKKRAVQEGEGQALAAKGDRRGYAALNLVDDEGVDELVTQLARIFSQDPNVNVVSWKKASEATLQWSADKIAEKMAGIGLGSTVAKSHRVLAIIPSNSSGVLEKFSEILFPSSFLLVQADDCWTCEEMIDKENALLEAEKATAAAAPSGTDDSAAGSSSGGESLPPTRLPIIAIIVPPSAPERVLREATGGCVVCESSRP